MSRSANLVGGEWVAAVAGEHQDILCPATGKTIAVVPKGGAEDVDRAVATADRAFASWARTTPKERADLLLALADAIVAAAEEFAELESLNVGKPLPMARDEVAGSVDTLRFFAGAARCLQGPVAGDYMAGHTSWLRREPLGVIGQITPWNYPLMMAVWKIGPALAAGNTVVLKPAEATPLTTLLLAELAAEILPAGVLNVITGDGVPVGAALAAHPGIALVSVTGSVETGRRVSGLAAESLKRTHLELGGKAPAIVFDDADVAAVVEGIKVAGFWNAGQECAAACRVLAGPKTYDSLLEALVPAVESLAVGDPAGGAEVDMGPLISERHRERVLGFVDGSTSAAGARILTGGFALPGDGFFVAPTVIAGVEQSSEIVQREVFGPVVTVQRFSDEEEALDWADDSSYGLSASIWTADVGRAMAVASRLHAGTVWINDHLALISEMPWSGVRQSGHGSDMSIHALDGYSHLKHTMAKARP